MVSPTKSSYDGTGPVPSSPESRGILGSKIVAVRASETTGPKSVPAPLTTGPSAPGPSANAPTSLGPRLKFYHGPRVRNNVKKIAPKVVHTDAPITHSGTMGHKLFSAPRLGPPASGPSTKIYKPCKVEDDVILDPRLVD